VKPPLAIIPSYVSTQEDLALLEATVKSVLRTAGSPIDVLIVDDGSPAADGIGILDLWPVTDEDSVFITYKEENTGFSSTVNVGLQRALEEGRNAFLINADIEMLTSGWVERCEQQPGLVTGKRAAVVGALLLYPNRLIQHAGIYFSLLTRTFDHLYKFGPWNLPEALEPDVRPVTGAFQFIRHETLTNVGLYDETFKLGWEDVDYCIRVLLSERECIYQPAVRAMHHESMFRGRGGEKVQRWQAQSFWRLMDKYREQSFAGLVPML
jgi:GT2 family glycosyltransferase